MFRSLCLLLTALPLAANHPCQSCHPAQVAAFARSPLGNAIAPAQPAPPGAFTHAPSQSRFDSFNRQGQMWHRLTRGSLSAEFPLALRIGSGAHAAGYLLRHGNTVFQAAAALARPSAL
ncbi:MAG: hypothetical protein ACK527_14190, partial [Acidobacteriota bacterium]